MACSECDKLRDRGDALLKRCDAVLKALHEIAKGKGTFSLDHHIHAENTVYDMKGLAEAALAEDRAMR